MTPEQDLKDAENLLQKARAENGNSPAVEYILDALGLMLNAQVQMLTWLRGKPDQ